MKQTSRSSMSSRRHFTLWDLSAVASLCACSASNNLWMKTHHASSVCYGPPSWLNGKMPRVCAAPEQLRHWPISIPDGFSSQCSWIIRIQIISVHALRLNSRAGRSVWWCHL